MAKEKTTKKDKKKTIPSTPETESVVEVNETTETEETVEESTEEENKDDEKIEESDEVVEEEKVEETVQEEVKEPVKEEIPVVVDEIEELIKPQTNEEIALVKIMKDYKFLSEIPEDKVKIKDLENKIVKLCDLIYFPHQANVNNPNYLYNDIEKFFTKYRKTILKESFAIKYSYAIGNKQRFANCITIYTLLIALIDCKLNKKPFTMNIDTASKMLGASFEKFIAWISERSERFK